MPLEPPGPQSTQYNLEIDEDDNVADDDEDGIREGSYHQDVLTGEELERVLKLLKNGESPGEDNITKNA